MGATHPAMKTQTKKIWIIGGIIVVYLLLMSVQRWRSESRLAQLPGDDIVGSGRPVLLELGASWCGPCRQMAPILVELSREQDAFLVGHIDIDAAAEKARQYGVEAIPLLLFFDGAGNILYRQEGFMAKEQILKKWDTLGVGG